MTESREKVEEDKVRRRKAEAELMDGSRGPLPPHGLQPTRRWEFTEDHRTEIRKDGPLSRDRWTQNKPDSNRLGHINSEPLNENLNIFVFLKGIVGSRCCIYCA